MFRGWGAVGRDGALGEGTHQLADCLQAAAKTPLFWSEWFWAEGQLLARFWKHGECPLEDNFQEPKVCMWRKNRIWNLNWAAGGILGIPMEEAHHLQILEILLRPLSPRYWMCEGSQGNQRGKPIFHYWNSTPRSRAVVGPGKGQGGCSLHLFGCHACTMSVEQSCWSGRARTGAPAFMQLRSLGDERCCRWPCLSLLAPGDSAAGKRKGCVMQMAPPSLVSGAKWKKGLKPVPSAHV